MLDRQVAQEYDILSDLIQDNDFILTNNGASITVTKEDPIAPVEVAHNNVRNKLMDAQSDVDRCSSAVVEVQKKVSEKRAVVSSHRQRINQLQVKKKHLMQDEGGVQKIKSVIRAIVRWGKDNGGMDVDQINEETSPSDLLKYIDKTVKSFQEKEEKPEHISKIIKRLKKLAKNDLGCPCCMRQFQNDDELVNFQTRMTELGDPDVSELHQMANKKAKDVREALEKHDTWRRIVSENINSYLEYDRVINELQEQEQVINDEEGGRGSLKDLEAELKTEEAALEEKKEKLKELNALMTTLNSIQDTAKRVFEKMGNVKGKKENIKFKYLGSKFIMHTLPRVKSFICSDIHIR